MTGDIFKFLLIHTVQNDSNYRLPGAFRQPIPDSGWTGRQGAILPPGKLINLLDKFFSLCLSNSIKKGPASGCQPG
jgi:hypothetical protein